MIKLETVNEPLLLLPTLWPVSRCVAGLHGGSGRGEDVGKSDGVKDTAFCWVGAAQRGWHQWQAADRVVISPEALLSSLAQIYLLKCVAWHSNDHLAYNFIQHYYLSPVLYTVWKFEKICGSLTFVQMAWCQLSSLQLFCWGQREAGETERAFQTSCLSVCFWW